MLGRFYAQALVDSGVDFDLLFGPAYKGIPIATTTAVALADHHQRDVPYCFNRKEAKDHGEGGLLVGSPLEGRVMLVDDVITAGTAIRESMEIIAANGARLAGVLISLDRQERGRGEISAIQEVERDYQCHVTAIITLSDLIEYLEEKPEMADHLAAVRAYRKTTASDVKSGRRAKSPPGVFCTVRPAAPPAAASALQTPALADSGTRNVQSVTATLRRTPAAGWPAGFHQ